MAIVRMDPWRRIVNVHWKREVGRRWCACIPGIPTAPPLPFIDYSGWEEPHRASYNPGYTGLIPISARTNNFEEVFSIYEARAAEHGPYAVFIMQTDDPSPSLPLTEWNRTPWSTNGFLPFTVGWGRTPFNDNDFNCPPSEYVLHGGWSSQANALDYIRWSLSQISNPDWNANEYARGSRSIIYTEWQGGSGFPPDPTQHGTVVSCVNPTT